MDEFYERRNQVLKHLKEVEEFTTGPTPVLVDQLVEITRKELKRIKKKEQKLNT